MSSYSKILMVVASTWWLTGCAVSQTEAEFGNSVRHMMTEQRIAPSGPLKADEPIQSGDGRRLENVTTVHQSHVGDPKMVVKEMEVERQSGSGR